MTQETQPIVVTHILPTGTAFGATMHRPPESVFIPAKVTRACDLQVGDEVQALVLPNTMQPDRTPWFAPYVSRPTTPVGEPVEELVSARVRGVMREGGVWTVGTMFKELFPEGERRKDIAQYNAISAALRAMFANEECAKFQLWRKPGQTKPGREWFTCYPEHADVDEWIEEQE